MSDESNGLKNAFIQFIAGGSAGKNKFSNHINVLTMWISGEAFLVQDYVDHLPCWNENLKAVRTQ